MLHGTVHISRTMNVGKVLVSDKRVRLKSELLIRQDIFLFPEATKFLQIKQSSKVKVVCSAEIKTCGLVNVIILKLLYRGLT